MQLWQKFKFGIFDVDGTIFDNMPLSADAFFETISEFKLPKEARLDQIEARQAREIYLETNGMNLDDQYRLVFDKYGVKYDDVLIKNLHDKFFDLRDNSEVWKKAPLFSGVKELLEKLSENGVKNFISTGSNTNETLSRLKNAGIDEYFTLVLGGDKFPKGQKHFEESAKFLKIDEKEFKSQAFLYSDGANDMALAKNAGIFAIGVANTLDTEKLKSAGANTVIEDAGESLDWEF